MWFCPTGGSDRSPRCELVWMCSEWQWGSEEWGMRAEAVVCILGIVRCAVRA